jgi:PAS domain S-box-containing protein
MPVPLYPGPETVKSQSLNFDLVEIAGIGIWVFNSEIETTYVNRPMAAMLGYRQEEMMALPISALWNQEGRQKSEAYLGRLKEGLSETSELDLLHRDGSVVRTFISSTAIFDNAGKLCGAVAMLMDITRYKLAQEERDRNYALLKAITDNADDVIFVKDLSGRYLMVNRAVEHRAGRKPEEFIGRSDADFFSEADVAKIMERDRRVVELGETSTSEIMIEVGGELRPTLTTKTPYRDSTGKVVGIVGISRDITERKVVENALRESEEKYRSILESIHDGYYECDLEGTVTFANDPLARLYGYNSKEEFVGHNFREYSDQKTVERVYQACNEVFRTGQPCPLLDYQITDAQGNERWVTVSISPIRDGNQRIEGFRGISRDVTESVHSREALRFTEECFARAFNASPYAMSLTTFPEGRFVMINERMANEIGYDPGEIIGRSFVEIDYWTNPEERFALGELLESQGYVRDWETRLRRRDGEIRDRLLSMELIEIDGRRYTLSASNDITARKQSEEDLAQSREQLRALSARIESIREEERKRIAREIHDELGQLLTGIKMDLAWMDKNIGRSADAELKQKLVPRINELNRLMENTIQSVRDIASKLRPVVLDELGLIAAIKWQVGDFTNRTGIKFDLRLCGEPAGLSPDRATALFRIFQEILTNIARHASAKNVRVELSNTINAMKLMVADDGIGISPEQMKNSKSLGLVGMRERALSFNGHIEIEGLPGTGTIIRVSIPLR